MERDGSSGQRGPLPGEGVGKNDREEKLAAPIFPHLRAWTCIMGRSDVLEICYRVKCLHFKFQKECPRVKMARTTLAVNAFRIFGRKAWLHDELWALRL